MISHTTLGIMLAIGLMAASCLVAALVATYASLVRWKHIALRQLSVIGRAQNRAGLSLESDPLEVIERLEREAARESANADRAIAMFESAEYKVFALAHELAKEMEESERLRADLAMVKTNVDGVWMWQGDGQDHHESLSCSVVMSAAALRELLAAAHTDQEAQCPAHCSEHGDAP